MEPYSPSYAKVRDSEFNNQNGYEDTQILVSDKDSE